MQRQILTDFGFYSETLFALRADYQALDDLKSIRPMFKNREKKIVC